MKLNLIKEEVSRVGITLKELCERIGMTYQNLNRCIRDNKITANDLEKISVVLHVPVCIFFDAKSTPNCVINHKAGKYTSEQNMENEKLIDELEIYKKELEYLKKEIGLKDKIIDLLEKR